MIVLDTHVLSQLMRRAPDERVVHWMDNEPDSSLFTTTVTQAEILYGASVLPAGKKKQALSTAVDAMFGARQPSLSPRSAQTVRAWVDPISQFNAQIAAIARSRALAARNTPDFEECGIQVIDPWHHRVSSGCDPYFTRTILMLSRNSGVSSTRRYRPGPRSPASPCMHSG